MSEIHIGRLLRASTRMCVAGCQIGQPLPDFGSLVSIPLDDGLRIYGLITDIHIDDDGLVRQLSVSDQIAPEVIADNRVNRNVPVELSVLFTGHAQGDTLSHLLPPRPPLSLDNIFLCGDEEIVRFTYAGRLGYFRHILTAEDISTADVLAAHLLQAGNAHQNINKGDWLHAAVHEIIRLLRYDHDTLMTILYAIADAYPDFEAVDAVEGGIQ